MIPADLYPWLYHDTASQFRTQNSIDEFVAEINYRQKAENLSRSKKPWYAFNDPDRNCDELSHQTPTFGFATESTTSTGIHVNAGAATVQSLRQ